MIPRQPKASILLPKASPAAGYRDLLPHEGQIFHPDALPPSDGSTNPATVPPSLTPFLIAENDYNLNIPLYVEKTIEDDLPTVAEALADLRRLGRNARRPRETSKPSSGSSE
jgi:hypothetical protein